MGIVYKARQLKLGRTVAVKTILTGHQASVAELARFRTEAQTVAQLQHPNIVAIHEVGEVKGQPFFCMDFVAGQNLAQLVGDTPLAAKRAASYVKRIAEAAHYAHGKGVLHRDLKPSNVLIDAETDEPRVTDFGLAKRLEGDASLTITGQVLGSPGFMPPEQASGVQKDIGPTSDVYSLGAILYHALTGRAPFAADTVPATLRMVVETDAVSPRLLNGSVPRDLETVCLKCLEKAPRRRYASAQALSDELGRYLRDEPVLASPPSAVYRFQKLIRRNKLAFTAVLAAVASLFIGLSTAAWQFVEKSKAYDRAVTSERVQTELRKKAEAALISEAAEKEKARDANLRAEHRAREAELKAVESTLFSVELAVREGDMVTAQDRLNSIKPDDRNWEWLWLARQADSSFVTFSNRVGSGLHYDSEHQRMVFVGAVEVAEYDTATWQLSKVKPLGHVASLAATPPLIRDDPYPLFQIIGLDANGRRGVFRYSASGNHDSQVHYLALMDSTNLKKLIELEVPVEGIGGTIPAVAFSPDGTRFTLVHALGGNNQGSSAERVSHIWNSATGKIIHSLRPAGAKVKAAAFSPDGNVLATGSVSKRASQNGSWADTLCFWDVKTGELLYSCLDDGTAVIDLIFSPDGKVLYAGDAFGVSIVDLAGAKPHLRRRVSLLSGVERLTSIALSSKGDVLAVGLDNGHIRLLDAASVIQKQVLFGHQFDVLKMTFLREDTALAALNHNQIKVWDVTKDSSRNALHSGGAPTFAGWSLDKPPTLYAFNPNYNATPGGKVGVPGGWGTAEIWNLASRQVRRISPAASDMRSLAFTPKRNLLALGRVDACVEIRQCPQGDSLKEFKTGDGEISALEFSPDGTTVAMGYRSGAVTLWSVDTTNLLKRIPGDGVEIGRLAFVDNGRMLLVATSGARFTTNGIGRNAAVTVSGIHTDTWETLWKWNSQFPESRPVTLVGLISDSRQAYVQNSAGGLTVLNLKTGDGRKVRIERGLGYWPAKWKQSLALSPDSSRLASIDEGTHLVKILRTEDFAEMLTLVPAGRRAEGVAWSPDGTKIVVFGVGEAGDIEVFDSSPLRPGTRSAAN